MQLPWTNYQRIARADAGFELQRQRACPLCGCEEGEMLLELNDFQFYDDQGGVNRADHRIVSCDNCGLLYTNPCYTDKGFALLFEKAGCSYGHSDMRPGEQFQWLQSECPTARSVMDIGCGMGDFLKSLPSDWQRVGVEVDPALVKAAQQDAQGINFMQGNLSGRLELPVVDVITMFHVLEHVPDPVNVLNELRRNSGAVTRLLVEVPLVDRASSMQGNDIVGFFSVQHLSHFSRNTLLAMLAQTGWQVVKCEEMEGYNGFRVLAEPGSTLSSSQQPSADEQQKSTDAFLTADYLNGWNKVVAAINAKLDSLAGDGRIVVWGAGQHTEYLALLTSLFSASRSFVIVDSDPLKKGTRYHGIPVVSADDIEEDAWRNGDFKVVISTYGSQEAVKQAILDRGVEASRIVTLYDEIRRY